MFGRTFACALSKVFDRNFFETNWRNIDKNQAVNFHQ